MADRHWSDEQLLARLYGMEQGDGHLHDCAECLRRWKEICARRRELLGNRPHVSTGYLAEQRNAVRKRITAESPRLRLRLAPALAALLLLVAVVMLFQPWSKPPTPPQTADNKVFEDAFTLASAEEPEAVEPIQALFEVQQ